MKPSKPLLKLICLFSLVFIIILTTVICMKKRDEHLLYDSFLVHMSFAVDSCEKYLENKDYTTYCDFMIEFSMAVEYWERYIQKHGHISSDTSVVFHKIKYDLLENAESPPNYLRELCDALRLFELDYPSEANYPFAMGINGIAYSITN